MNVAASQVSTTVVSVQFQGIDSPTNAVLSALPCQHTVLWYIGKNGLTKGGVDFYRDNIIAPMRSMKRDMQFWFLDLTGWNQLFRGPFCKRRSRFVESINSYTNLNCVPSDDLLQELLKPDPPEYVESIQTILNRESVWEMSKKHAKNNISLKDIFPLDGGALANYFAVDTAHAYSALQYLETCLLICRIIKHARTSSIKQDICISFLLPNDEVQYYSINPDLFGIDIENTMRSTIGIDENHSITIRMVPFAYGQNSQYRPYNLPSKRLKDGELSYARITGFECACDSA